jgi:hypothetical protein
MTKIVKKAVKNVAIPTTMKQSIDLSVSKDDLVDIHIEQELSKLQLEKETIKNEQINLNKVFYKKWFDYLYTHKFPKNSLLEFFQKNKMFENDFTNSDIINNDFNGVEIYLDFSDLNLPNYSSEEKKKDEKEKELKDRIYDIMNKKSELESKEYKRKLKASLAVNALKTSEEGKTILELLSKI